MCDRIKNLVLLQHQLEKAIVEDVEIIEIEFISGKTRFRDRWSIERILRDDKMAEKDRKSQN